MWNSVTWSRLEITIKNTNAYFLQHSKSISVDILPLGIQKMSFVPGCSLQHWLTTSWKQSTCPSAEGRLSTRQHSYVVGHQAATKSTDQPQDILLTEKRHGLEWTAAVRLPAHSEHMYKFLACVRMDYIWKDTKKPLNTGSFWLFSLKHASHLFKIRWII